MSVANKDKLLARAGDGNIQFTVDSSAVFCECIAGEEVQFLVVAYSRAEHYDVALRALIALYGVNADVVEFLYSEFLYFPCSLS